MNQREDCTKEMLESIREDRDDFAQKYSDTFLHLEEAEKIRDEWCAEYTKLRNSQQQHLALLDEMAELLGRTVGKIETNESLNTTVDRIADVLAKYQELLKGEWK